MRLRRSHNLYNKQKGTNFMENTAMTSNISKQTANIPEMILADGVALYGKPGETRYNDNVLVVGPSGAGKTCSFVYPNLKLAMKKGEENLILVLPKSSDLMALNYLFGEAGYETYIVNLAEPDRSTISPDILPFIHTDSDIADLAEKVIWSKSPAGGGKIDPYWNQKAGCLFKCAMSKAKRLRSNATIADAIFDMEDLDVEEEGSHVSTSWERDINELIEDYGRKDFAVKNYLHFAGLPIKTASCVVDTLDAAIHDMFSEDLLSAMKKGEALDLRRFVREKSVLFLVTSPVDTSSNAYANLFTSLVLKEFFEIAMREYGGVLPRKQRFVYDDFACGAMIKDFDKQISIFRSASICCSLLLQSESQLSAMYGKDAATTIINNCSTYIYMGGFDLDTCRNVSERTNRPLDEILKLPIGECYVMKYGSGEKPILAKRYPILEDPFYRRMKRASELFARPLNKDKKRKERSA